MQLIHCLPGDANFKRHFPELGSPEDSFPADAFSLPNFVSAIVITENSTLLARLALFHNPAMNYNNQLVMMAGYLRCENKKDVAKLLFEEAEKVTRNAGLRYIIAPINANTWNDYRLPLSGETALFTGDNSQPLYLGDLFLDAGFKVIERYYSSKASLEKIHFSEIDIQQQLAQEGIFIRSLNDANFLDELRLLYPVCNRAFAHNPLFSETTWEAFLSRYLPMKPLLDFPHTLLAFDEENTLLALMICYRDQQDITGQTLVLKTIAKNPEKNIPGLMSRMGELLYAKAKAAGYTSIIHAMMHEANPSIRRSQQFGGTVLRTYGLFGKQL